MARDGGASVQIEKLVDAYDPSTKTVYEFWGDWWHGHPDYFDPTAIHPMAKVTYGELYQKTMEKRKLILSSGYKLVEIWEHDFDKIEGKVGKRPRRK